MKMPTSRKTWIASASLLLLAIAITQTRAEKAKCQDDECQMSEQHFKLYSTVRRVLEENFNLKGRDIVPFLRTVDVLKRRFEAAANNLPPSQQPNGTKLVQDLLADERLHEALDVFSSDQGRELINLYKTSINGNQQNLACSLWRVNEMEFASKRLEQAPKLAKVFANIHRSFVERSARKCLKSACSSIDDSMNHLDSIQRRSSRRKGFIAREELAGKLVYETSADAAPQDDELVAQVESEPRGEFSSEELELCRFFKRTNASVCQASGNELSQISFLKAVSVDGASVQSDWNAFLADYMRNKRQLEFEPSTNINATNTSISSSAVEDQSAKRNQATRFLLGQCHAITPMLDYHLSGLRWYQKQELILSHKLHTRTFWCPSLAYWLEIDRLCNELEVKLSSEGLEISASNKSAMTFAY